MILSDTNYEGAEILSERISEALKKKPMILEETRVTLSMSFGFSTYEDQLDASEMIMQADQSLFEAKKKRKGKNGKA